MQPLQHVCKQSVHKLCCSGPEGAQQPQPLLRQRLCTALSCPCTAHPAYFASSDPIHSEWQGFRPCNNHNMELRSCTSHCLASRLRCCIK